LKRKNADGEWVPTEITKTVIERDGSRKVSVERFEENMS
jgi:hypothetical protein